MSTKITFKELFDLFEESGVKPRTISNNYRPINAIIKHAGDVPCLEMTYEYLRNLQLTKMIGYGERYLTEPASTIFTWGVNNSLLPYHPITTEQKKDQTPKNERPKESEFNLAELHLAIEENRFEFFATQNVKIIVYSK